MCATRPLFDRLQNLRVLAGELGGLVLVWLGEATGLQSYALPATLALISLDAVSRWRMHVGFPTIWFVLNAMALSFGALSLIVTGRLSPEEFGALCAFLLALVFLIGSLTRVSLIQALAEQREGSGFGSETPFLDHFFRLYTRIWAGFFLIRGIYLLYLDTHPHDALTAGIVLKTSLIGMILLSFRGKTLYRRYAALRRARTV
ncbi:hypothetical protein HW511_11570 [Asaia siamensis]|uniref:DUF3159 domain-containing protein n=1 Tax=Asaia siamensis TaxID=110479 RepID=A0ABQ1MG97_9PROT|nr:hypothetical protein [Asaia siamensis]GBR07475.1 hypothetical protein AA0323_1815 [Asaia siamensis NRIC 0323]GGC36930.1 hypothetical protein GCM10007207_23130 [Asaia siamensis]